ncbi:hydroxyacylglutathione hydrolase C-terminal domain-containing protein, partial [Methylobacterium trifolii]
LKARFLVLDSGRRNPFVRSGEPALARAVGLPSGSDPAAVFTALRAWKNRF